MNWIINRIKIYNTTLQLQGGFIDKVLDFLIRIVSLIVFPVIYLLLLIIRPFKKIKIGFLYNRRLGHLALNTDMFLRQQQLGVMPTDTYYLFFSYKPANEQIVKMFQRNMNLINSEFLSKLFSPIGLFRTRFWQPLPFKSNEHYEFNEANRSLFFTPEEKQFGKQELAKMGIAEDDWYVCIFARDEAYANAMFASVDHSSTNHRNGDIDTYIEAAKYIVEQGGFVVRMGYKVGKEFGYKHPKVVDYAVDYRTDFLDIYLSAHCRFYLGTSNGAADLARIFDKPQAAVNYLPIGMAPFGKNEIFIPKNIIYKNSQKNVSFEKQIEIIGDLIVAFGVAPENKLNKLKMEMLNNTPEQILELVKEIFSRLNGTFKEDEKYIEKLEAFNNILVKHNHWCSNFKQTIGKDFLMKMELNDE